jgi:hypothetical protein
MVKQSVLIFAASHSEHFEIPQITSLGRIPLLYHNTMPLVKRDDIVMECMSKNFNSFGLLDKVAQVATTVTAMILVLMPEEILSALGIVKDKYANKGRLREVIKNQIYQQPYKGGGINSTIFKSRNGDALLMHIAPRMSPEFKEDIRRLGAPIKYILISNEAHESLASEAKEAFPDALVIVPAVSKALVEVAVKVDGTIEEHAEKLKKDFGFVETFNGDEIGHCSSERSYAVEIFGSSSEKVLFVGQCGYGNLPQTFSLVLAGFSGFLTAGRFFRMFYYTFTKNHGLVRPFWHNMVNSVDNISAAIFTHGMPINGKDTKEKLLQFYVY